MQRTFTDNQNQAIGTDGRDICVAAGAGSGKTGVLVERFVRLVTQSRQGLLPPEQRAGVEEILVITFTEKATKEMKTRIVAELTRLGLTEERRQVETAYISTIHGFCSRLLQENPFEVGIDPHFTVLEEPQARRLLRQTVEAVIAKAYEGGDEEIAELVATVQGLRQFGEEQANPIVSLAEAVERVLSKLRGAGQRREEVERHWQGGAAVTAAHSEEIVWSVLTPVLEEIQDCLRQVRVLYAGLLGTARSTCETLLTCAGSIRTRGLLTETLPALHEMYQALRKMRTRTVGATEAEMQLAQYVARIKTACDSRAPLFETILPDSAQSALACQRMWGLTAAAWRAYDEAKRQRGKADNDDLQAECARLLEDFPDVRRRYQSKLRYLMIDEFQDTDPLQMRLIELLHITERDVRMAPNTAADGETGATTSRPLLPNYLFVVGDVQQSIYGFRGAEPSLFRDLERQYREEHAGTHVPLAVNFRSRPEILRLIALLFRQIWRNAETPFVPLEAGAPFDARTGPRVELLLSQDLLRQDYMQMEPAALAQRVRQLVEGEEILLTSHFDSRRGEPVRYRDIAVLLRQLTDIQKYEEAFARAGVPYFVVGGGRGYYARQEIRDLLNILTVLDTPLNDVALMAALRSPIVGADIDTLYRIVELANAERPTLPLYIAMQRMLETEGLPEEEEAKVSLFVEVMDSLRAQEDRMPVGHLMERLISRTAYDARLLCRPNGRRRLANVRKLLQMANADPVLGVRDFIRRLRDLEKLSDREGDAPTEEEASDVVRFHTIHGAKGLEFPVVILADLCRSLEHPERGLFVCDPRHLALGTRVCGVPDAVYRAIDHRRREADREETERLLYVAMTRAREHLILCGNLGRNRGVNWGDHLFPALGVIEAPPQPVLQTLIGGVDAVIAPLAHYAHMSIVGDAASAGSHHGTDPASLANRLLEALLTDEPFQSIGC